MQIQFNNTTFSNYGGFLKGQIIDSGRLPDDILQNFINEGRAKLIGERVALSPVRKNRKAIIDHGVS